jgi:hypothetical protein
MPKRLLLAALLLSAAPAWSDGPDVAPVIEGIEEDLGAIRGIIEEMDTARATPLPLVRDRDDVREDLNAQLDTILTLVLGDLYPQSREELFALDAELERVDERIAELQVDRLTAPRSADVAGFLDQTLNRHAPGSVEAIEQETGALERQRAELEARRTALLRRFAEELFAIYGVEITPDEAEAALYQVNGVTIVESAVAFEVVRKIEERLREIRTATDDDAVLRRYYAVAAVTRLLIQRLYERHLQSYEEEWLPRLAEIEARNDRLIAETEEAIRTADDGRRPVYEGNLEVQRQVDEVIDAYREMLAGRQELTRRGLEVAQADAAVALNTLKTLEAAVSLQAQMLWSRQEFETLMEIAPPELIPLDDEEMFQRFLDVSRELATTS